MVCCMVSKSHFGDLPKWIQWQLLRESFHALFPTDNNVTPQELSTCVLELIAKYADCEIIPDPKRRNGEFSIQKTSVLWGTLTAGGRLRQDKVGHTRDNLDTGSSFYPLLFNFAYYKQNGNIMHTPCGYTAHFYLSIAGNI